MKHNGKDTVRDIWLKRINPTSGLKAPALIYPGRDDLELLDGTVGLIEYQPEGSRAWVSKYGPSGYISFAAGGNGGVQMAFAEMVRGRRFAMREICGEMVDAEFGPDMRVRVVGVFGTSDTTDLLLV